VIQTVAIRSHVLVTLDLAAGNYGQWHRFFRTVIDKFGLADHINLAAVRRTDDPEWVMIDHAVTHWLYITISPELLNVVMQPGDTTVSVWAAIAALFRDNNLSHAVYIDAEYHAVVQGDMSIMQYCSWLKSFANQLRDLGQPVTETQQVFNLIRGLGRQYHGAIPHLTSFVPLPSFLQARSFLMLEEHRAEQSAREHALYASRAPAVYTAPSAPVPAAPAPTPAAAYYGAPSSSTSNRNKGKGKGKGKGKAPDAVAMPHRHLRRFHGRPSTPRPLPEHTRGQALFRLGLSLGAPLELVCSGLAPAPRRSWRTRPRRSTWRHHTATHLSMARACRFSTAPA
jgi:hypothetical protein